MSRPLLPEVVPGRVVGVDVARALAEVARFRPDCVSLGADVSASVADAFARLERWGWQRDWR